MLKQSERILFFDLAISGHHTEYLYHLINYRFAHPEYPEFVLLTHPGFMERVADLNLPSHFLENGIRIVHPSLDEMRRLQSKRSVFSRADEEFRILCKNIEKFKAQCCYLMDLSIFQFVLGTTYAQNCPFAIRGLLFKPYSAMDDDGPFVEKCFIKLLKLRKHMQFLWLLRNKKIDQIYVLNNPEAAKYLNERYQKKNLFIALADPILIPPGHFDNKAIDVGRDSLQYRFLLFGSLSSRKGIFHVIDALRCLPVTVLSQIEVIFAGKVIDKERDRFRSAISGLQRDRPKIRITLHDEFIPYKAIPVLFLESDCVLLPYSLTGASSGIIGHSALYGKPVIGPAKGLIGKQIKSYGLGIGIEPINGTSLAAAMIDFVKKGPSNINNVGMQRFVEERQPDNFVATLLGASFFSLKESIHD